MEILPNLLLHYSVAYLIYRNNRSIFMLAEIQLSLVKKNVIYNTRLALYRRLVY